MARDGVLVGPHLHQRVLATQHMILLPWGPLPAGRRGGRRRWGKGLGLTDGSGVAASGHMRALSIANQVGQLGFKGGAGSKGEEAGHGGVSQNASETYFFIRHAQRGRRPCLPAKGSMSQSLLSLIVSLGTHWLVRAAALGLFLPISNMQLQGVGLPARVKGTGPCRAH